MKRSARLNGREPITSGPSRLPGRHRMASWSGRACSTSDSGGSGRDYAQAGQWFRRSLDLAQGLADPKLHARSLNRVGNWLVNTGRAEDGLQAHQEALAIFETLQDTQGMAETFDLLGMANGIYGDTVTSRRAVRPRDHFAANPE